MFFVFLSRAYQLPTIDKDRLYKYLLSQEDTPLFNRGLRDDYTEPDENYNRDTIITGGYRQSRREYTFYKCSITIKGDTVFEGNYAFGAGPESGNGGAINIVQSIMVVGEYPKETPVGKVKFNKNQASVGGGICAFESAILIYSTDFKSNLAYKFGGAIFYHAAYENLKPEDEDIASSLTLIASNLLVDGNTANELGGGLCLSIAKDIYLDESLFVHNTAGFAGGAISALNVEDLKLYKDRFYLNKVDLVGSNRLMNQIAKKGINGNGGKTIDSKYPSQVGGRGRGRGGGAISIFSDDLKGAPKGPATRERRFLSSQQCCFGYDSATTTGYSNGHGPGHEILLDGYVKWLSLKDWINGWVDEESAFNMNSDFVSRVATVWPLDSAQWQIETPQTEAGCGIPDEYWPNQFPDFPKENLVQYASNVNQAEEKTAEVPDPTTFTYQATAITRLPSPTYAGPYTPATKLPIGRIEPKDMFGDAYTPQNELEEVVDKPARTVTRSPIPRTPTQSPAPTLKSEEIKEQDTTPTKEKLDYDWTWIYIVIAILFCLLVILIVLVIVFCHDKNRKRRLQSETLAQDEEKNQKDMEKPQDDPKKQLETKIDPDQESDTMDNPMQLKDLSEGSSLEDQ